MNKINNSVKIDKNGDEYYITLDDKLVIEKVENILKEIHLNKENIAKYVDPVNDELVNEIILRMISELFINNISMEDNTPYIVNVTINGVAYRLSITKLNIDNEINYMYGLIMN